MEVERPGPAGAARNRGTGKRRRRLQWMNESTESTERTGNVTTGLRFNTARLLISGPAQALGWAALLASVYPWLWNAEGIPAFKLDAWIYYHGIAQWHAGGSLYDWWANPREQLWPFTYPPFAAWALTPLTWVDDRTAQVLMVLATPLCTAVTAWATALALGARRRAARAMAPWLALAGVLFLEPIYKTMEYGQVNAILMMLVAVDLLAVPAKSPWRGVGAGLAAAFKLTPAIAVVVLLARREWRTAATMTGTAIGVTALCWIVSPAESTQFFLSAMLDPSRAGFPEYAGNQNLKGAIARWLPEGAWTPVWALAAIAVCLGTWLLLRRLTAMAGDTEDRHDHADNADHDSNADNDKNDGASPHDRLILSAQVGVAMMAGLLISPISWSHHWVWCLPILMTLATAAWRWYSPALAVTALAGAAVFALAMQWWFPGQNHAERNWPFIATVVGSSYTWWALAAGVALWTAGGRVAHHEIRIDGPEDPETVRSARATFRRHPRR